MEQDRPRRRALAFGWLAVVAAVLYLTWWGILRGAAASGDLAVGYGAGSAWVRGEDPYDLAVLTAHVRAGGADQPIAGRLQTLLDVYFPTTLPSFAPLAPLSWDQAKFAVLALNIAAAAFIAWGLVRLLGWRRSEARTLWLVAFVLGLAPLHTTMAIGQVAILATAAIVAAMVLERSGRPIWAGVFYGLAIVLKVQIGLPIPGLPRLAPALGDGGCRGGDPARCDRHLGACGWRPRASHGIARGWTTLRSCPVPAGSTTRAR